MDEQMLVFAASEGGGFDVANFALLNTPIFVPEPATAPLLFAATVMLLFYRGFWASRG